jgi:hypothetical protein
MSKNWYKKGDHERSKFRTLSFTNLDILLYNVNKVTVCSSTNLHNSVNSTQTWDVVRITRADTCGQLKGYPEMSVVYKTEHEGARRFKPSGMWRCVDGRVVIAFIFSTSSQRRIIDSEDDSITIRRNAGNYSPSDKASHARKLECSATLLWKPQISQKTCMLTHIY